MGPNDIDSYVGSRPATVAPHTSADGGRQHRVAFADQHSSSNPNAAGLQTDIEAQHDSASSDDQQKYTKYEAEVDPFGRPLNDPHRSGPIPLSQVPLPVSALAPSSCEEKDSKHRRKHSADSASTKTGRTGKTGKSSGISNFFSNTGEDLQEKAQNLKLHVNHPQQVTSPRTRGWYQHVLAWVGRIGWCGKAVVYAMIGGLACQSAAKGDPASPNVNVQNQVSASPQGAFVLLGTTPGGPGASLTVLFIMMLALASYITWRFWEGLAGQGYDRTFSSKKNFFKFRVSPIVSGCVYCSYLVFILQLLDKEVRDLPPEPGKETWPATWRHSSLGRAGLALLGLSFIIATCIQLQGVFTKLWHKDYRSDLPAWVMRTVFTIGHIGFAGRAGAFLSLAILFIKDAGGVSDDDPHQYSMVANALLQLQANRGLRAVLMIIGILLITYGLFATLSAWARIFPTPSPSRERPVPASVLQECEEKSLSPPEAEECEIAGEEDEQLPRDIYEQERSKHKCASCGGDGKKCGKGCSKSSRHEQQASAPAGAPNHSDQGSGMHGRPQPQVLYAGGRPQAQTLYRTVGDTASNGGMNGGNDFARSDQDFVSINMR